MKTKIYRDKKTGKKLYPVCSWYNNQHKLYNAHDRAMNWCYDSNWCDEAQEWLDKVQHAMGWFDGCVINGLVYAPYEEYCLIKDIIGGYDMRH
jgi:hypothetical protein